MKSNRLISDSFLFYNFDSRLTVDPSDKTDNFCRKFCLCYLTIIKTCCNKGGGNRPTFYAEMLQFFKFKYSMRNFQLNKMQPNFKQGTTKVKNKLLQKTFKKLIILIKYICDNIYTTPPSPLSQSIFFSN